MARTVRVDLNHSEINRLLRSPSGEVHREVAKHTRTVTALAKQKANVDTGKMRSRINGEVIVRGKRVRGRIESPAEYTKYVHEGRGPVRVKKAKALRFKPKGSSAFIFRMKVGPYEGNPFLVDALEAGQPWPVTTDHRL